MFGSTTIGILLLITHILSSITVGILFKFWYTPTKTKKRNIISNSSSNTASFVNLGELIANSISNATSTILMIGGFIVIFSVIISILNESHVIYIINMLLIPLFNTIHIPASFIEPLIIGIFEITNGLSLISSIQIKNISINIILASFLLGIGGISVLLQIISITSKTDLSIKPYIIGKILQGIFSAFYSFMFIQFFPIFNLNL